MTAIRGPTISLMSGMMKGKWVQPSTIVSAPFSSIGIRACFSINRVFAD